jgi:WD40 repeat protein/tRNA A-37 threonylcarbamoyl transferase component Bud32
MHDDQPTRTTPPKTDAHPPGVTIPESRECPGTVPDSHESGGASTLDPNHPAATFVARMDALAQQFVSGARSTLTEDCRPVTALADYEILGELGRGGMGVVFKARHTKLNRTVALKMVLGPGVADGRAVIRFLAEAEAVAAVKHPNVVQVHDYGDAGGRPFMALEYLPGGTLAQRIEQPAIRDPRAAAEMLAKVARGVAAAHALGIVHRDLKPGNVLFDEAGEPKVADFGLAKRPTSSDLTATQARMGTPAYMSPEQAGGKTKFVGPQADVWALGIILYECLAGRRPFESEEMEGLFLRILTEEPVPLRQVAPTVPRDLALICLKCLGKQAHERYPTAKELADDLDRFLRGEPISVRPAGPVERVYRWSRRKPFQAAAVVLSGLAVVLAVAAAGAGWLLLEARGARNAEADARAAAEGNRDRAERAEAEATQRRGEAEQARDAATKARDEAIGIRYARDIHTAYQEFKANNLVRTRALLEGCPPRHRGWEWRYVHQLAHQELLTLEHPGYVEMAAFSRDGKRILTAGRDNTARIWDAQTGKLLRAIVTSNPSVGSAAFSPDGAWVVTENSSGTSSVWDSHTGNLVAVVQGGLGLSRTPFSADGSRMVTTDSGNTARVWDTRTWTRLYTLSGRAVGMRAAFSPDGGRLFTSDLTAQVWDAATGKRVSAPASGHANSAAFSPNSRYVLTTGNAKVQVWDAATGKEIATLAGHTEYVEGGSFSPDGTRVVTASEDKTARVWDTTTGKELLKLEGHTKGLRAAWFSPDGTRVLTAGKDRTARLFDAATGKPLTTFAGHTDYYVMTAEFNHDGSRVVTAGGADRSARVWDATTDAEVVNLTGMWVNSLSCAQWSPDSLRVAGIGPKGPGVWDVATGKQLVSLRSEKVMGGSIEFSSDGVWAITVPNRFGGSHPRVHLWNAATGEELRKFEGHTKPIQIAVLSRDRNRLVTADNKTARSWDTKTGQPLATFTNHKGAILVAAFAADGRTVLTGGEDKTLRVWDCDTGKELHALEGHTEAILWVGVSSDGRWASGANDRTVRFWDPVTGKELLRLDGMKNGIMTATFSPDGKRLVTADYDLVARVWDTSTGKELRQLVGHPGGVGFAAYHPDGTRIVTQGHDRTTRVWDAESGELLLTLGYQGDIGGIAFSPDGRRLLICSSGGTTILDSAPRKAVGP